MTKNEQLRTALANALAFIDAQVEAGVADPTVAAEAREGLINAADDAGLRIEA